ncbi:MAG: oxidoreductase [Acidobacteriota bacterium]
MATILITGASSGIGKAAAFRLLKDGHTVYGAARRLEKMQDLADAGARTLAMDVTEDDQVEAAVARIEREAGGVDVLVNNAGFAVYGAMEETSLADARYQFDVNFFGVARLTQRVLPGMRAKKAGTIINISSVGGKIYTPLGSWYHATKHALEGWSDCLRLEVAPFGIHVVIVEPGLIRTEFGDVMSAPMLERSGDGPYGELAHAIAAATEESYAPSKGASPPSVIGDVIAKAVAARRPKTRYAAGQYAKVLLFLRRFTSDRFFDRAIMSQT